MNLNVNEVINMLLKRNINKKYIEYGIEKSINNNSSFTFMIGKRKRILLNWIYSGEQKWSFKGHNSKNPSDYTFSIIELG